MHFEEFLWKSHAMYISRDLLYAGSTYIVDMLLQ